MQGTSDAERCLPLQNLGGCWGRDRALETPPRQMQPLELEMCYNREPAAAFHKPQAATVGTVETDP